MTRSELRDLIARDAGLPDYLADRLTGLTVTEMSADAEELGRLVNSKPRSFTHGCTVDHCANYAYPDTGRCWRHGGDHE